MTFVPRAALPEDVLRRPDVQDTLEKRDFGRLFFLARQWAGISYSAIAESCDIKPERVGSLARGRGTITSYAKIQQIADGMRIPGRMLGLLPRHWEHGPTARSTETLGVKASGTAFRPSASSRAGAPEAINAPAVGDADGLLADLDRLERDYDVASSAVLLGEAGLVHGALRRSGSTHRFLRLRARSALLMGQLLWDASHRRDGHAATVFFHEAVLAAHEARDQATLAQARLRTSFIPLYSGRSRDALVEVKRAANAATGVPYVRALVSLHVSEAYARLGRRAEAEGHLAEADRIAEQAAVPEPEWAGRVHRIAGSVYLALGLPAQAQTHLEQAALLQMGRAKSQGLVLANLALALARRQQPEEAAATLGRALNVVEVTHAGGALSLTADAARALAPWCDVGAVADVRERLFTLLAS